MQNEYLYKYSNWLIDWKTNYSSKSNCKAVIEIYEIILKNEFTDSDYWNADDEVNFKLSKFTETDWEQLKEDISNWKENQQEILYIVLTENNFFDKKIFQQNKSKVYTHLLGICSDNLFSEIIDDLNFLKLDNDKDINTLEIIKKRLLKMKDTPLIEQFYTKDRLNDFLVLIDEEIRKSQQ